MVRLLGTSNEISAQWLEQRAVWKTKPVLRTIYCDFYRRVGEWLTHGPTIELGCSSGNFKAFLPGCMAVDVLRAPWLNVVADAHELPFADSSVSNIVLIDVIHHLAEPRRFLEEAERVIEETERVITEGSCWSNPR